MIIYIIQGYKNGFLCMITRC